MNLLRGDLPRLSRGTDIVTDSAASDSKRSKPLKYAYEKEIVLYAHHKKLDYFSTECIYSPEAFRGSARTLIKDLEKIRPSSILDIVKSGEDLAMQVPQQIRSSGKQVPAAAAAAAAEDESAGGCGSQNGRTSGGEMAEMEKKLADDETAEGREVEIKGSSTSTGAIPLKKRPQQNDKQAKQLKVQTMGNCERCGYMSSQKICKACSLLDGLNRNRPKTAIEVGVGAEDEESSTTLMRQMERVQLTTS